MNVERLFSLAGKSAIVTGGTGVLGGTIARGLAAAGANVGVLGRRAAQAEAVATAIEADGGRALPLVADVLERGQLEAARDATVDAWGGIDVLVNAAGGNRPSATVTGDRTFFTLDEAAIEQVVRLNLVGTILPAQVFGEVMARGGAGSIVNVSSMSAQKPLTQVVAYAAAKAGIDNFTRWLAVELARRYGPSLRVNAVAPGFFVGEQNRALLLQDDGSPTERGQRIVDHTPMGRFGEPEELVGTVIWLAGEAARFVTGVVVPVDGGFSAYSGI